jgi:hypothetical protein
MPYHAPKGWLTATTGAAMPLMRSTEFDTALGQLDDALQNFTIEEIRQLMAEIERELVAQPWAGIIMLRPSEIAPPLPANEDEASTSEDKEHFGPST